jgi:hypothetical protein
MYHISQRVRLFTLLLANIFVLFPVFADDPVAYVSDDSQQEERQQQREGRQENRQQQREGRQQGRQQQREGRQQARGGR